MRGVDDVDVLIIDGRPYASAETTEIARVADLTVIPSGQTGEDLRPGIRLALALVEAGIDRERLAFALVRTTRSEAEVLAARRYIAEHEFFVLEGDLPLSTGLRDGARRSRYLLQRASSPPTSSRRPRARSTAMTVVMGDGDGDDDADVEGDVDADVDTE